MALALLLPAAEWKLPVPGREAGATLLNAKRINPADS
jgi:hypothetical protein